MNPAAQSPSASDLGMVRVSHRGRAVGVLIATFISCLASADVLRGQPTIPAGAPYASQPSQDGLDLAEGRRLLAEVSDNVYSFDDPAFYWFARWVRQDGVPLRYTPSPEDEPIPWRFLMERPSDYRGELVTIEGKLLRRESFDVPNREGVGRLTQCDLVDLGTRAVCSAILTNPLVEISIGSQVRLRGYFIKVRAFKTTAGESGAGPLVVSRDIQRVGVVNEGADIEARTAMVYKWLIGAIGLLGVLWLASKRIGRLKEVEADYPRADSKLDVTGTDDDFNWMAEENRSDSEVPPA